MYLLSCLVISSLRPPCPDDPSPLPSHQRLADRPLESSSSGTVLTAILGTDLIGEREGWNLSPPHGVSGGLSSSCSLLPYMDSVSVAGVNSVAEEHELSVGMLVDPRLSSAETDGREVSCSTSFIDRRSGKALAEPVGRHISRVKSIISPAIELNAIPYRSLRIRDSCTMKFANNSRRSLSVGEEASNWMNI